jgi:heterotetrameric sarcosine oxidase alpha subunit
MSQVNRVSQGLIDQSRPLSFEFNGKKYLGYQGDTLASALLANGQRLVGRSFKYHRPRGIFSAGSEEPNALVQLRKGAYSEPNTRATTVELFEGLSATSQNHRGSLERDWMAVNDYLAPFLTAGFYYKTFMWPKSFWEKVYEPIIRASAGLGKLSGAPDPDCYDKGFLHCDVLIIGAGPAGLAAALAAGRAGARVIIADEDFLPGGRLNCEIFMVDGVPGSTWAEQTVQELSSLDNVSLMRRTTVLGAFDHGIYSLLERQTDHLANSEGKPRQVLWRVYSKRAILCAGSTERSIVFANNDRPGVMLAGAVRAYVNRWGVTPGKRVAVFTNNDDGWRTAYDLLKKGVEVRAIVDFRPSVSLKVPEGVQFYVNERVIDTRGRHGIESIRLSNGASIETDCLAVSGGWNPNVHLSCHHRGIPTWNDSIHAFVPDGELPPGMTIAGAADGVPGLGAALASGFEAAKAIVGDLGFPEFMDKAPKAENESTKSSIFLYVKESKGRAWLDLQNDVTSKDVALAQQEGFRAVEHIKRYTTLGMATEQGKNANILALAVMAERSGKPIEEVGTTIFRPPYTPVAIGALAGRSRGKDFRPVRYTPSHKWAEQAGAVFVEAGAWLRAQWFPRAGESSWRESVDREVLQTRASVGICDVTTLGKIDIQGMDAGKFLNRIYCNLFSTLKVGKVRYGLMLREDGMAMDDGTTARLAENHYVMTTTTANAVSVFRHMEFCRQCLWSEMDVHLISATEQFAQYSVAGPNARKLLQKIVDPQFDISNEAFPYMACGEIDICGGVPARLFRISFSGELAYEIAVPTRYGNALIELLSRAGEEYDAVVYGTEALGVMRIEKGHAAGNELNGQITAQNLGMGRMVSVKKECIGNTLSHRSELNRQDGLELMGFKAVNAADDFKAGSHFINLGDTANTENDQGWMSSKAWSPSLGCAVGLGFIKSGREREGETVHAVNLLDGTDTQVKIVSPHFVDPEGERLRV